MFLILFNMLRSVFSVLFWLFRKFCTFFYQFYFMKKSGSFFMNKVELFLEKYMLTKSFWAQEMLVIGLLSFFMIIGLMFFNFYCISLKKMILFGILDILWIFVVWMYIAYKSAFVNVDFCKNRRFLNYLVNWCERWFISPNLWSKNIKYIIDWYMRNIHIRYSYLFSIVFSWESVHFNQICSIIIIFSIFYFVPSFFMDGVLGVDGEILL